MILMLAGIIGIFYFWRKDKKKRNISAIVAVISFVIFGIFADDSETENNTESNNETETQVANNEDKVTEDTTEGETETEDNTESNSETEEQVANDENKVTEDTTEGETETEDTSDAPFKEKAEQNAKEYPADVGRGLVSKGDNDFTGMPYYFSGELLVVGTAEAFEDKTVWLIRNDNGYVIPVEMIEGETAEVGSRVDVWGTLSGEGYQLPNVENIVGETGYLIMMQYDLNGEPVI